MAKRKTWKDLVREKQAAGHVPTVAEEAAPQARDADERPSGLCRCGGSRFRLFYGKEDPGILKRECRNCGNTIYV